MGNWILTLLSGLLKNALKSRAFDKGMLVLRFSGLA